MTSREQVENIIFESIDEVNAMLPEDEHLTKSLETRLLGEGGQVDSLGLVNLVVAVEQLVLEQLDLTIVLADEKAMSRKRSPFRSVETLLEHALECVQECERSDD